MGLPKGIETCRAHELFKVLGRAHATDVAYMLLDETPSPQRFREVQRRLGLSSKTVTARLKDLVEAGLVQRVAYDESPPRVEYEPTQRLRDLVPLLKQISGWVNQQYVGISVTAKRASTRPRPLEIAAASMRTPMTRGPRSLSS